MAHVSARTPEAQVVAAPRSRNVLIYLLIWVGHGAVRRRFLPPGRS
jgi:hypothetical protein